MRAAASCWICVKLSVSLASSRRWTAVSMNMARPRLRPLPECAEWRRANGRESSRTMIVLG
eukprot:7133395-Prymnesium_polylepis.1